MNKKILLGLGSALVVVAGVAGLAAFEAHVINVTAKIENALAVNTTPIAFGTVFPQEYLLSEENIVIELSQSFLDEDNADDVEYVIKQKPKPKQVDPDGLLKPDYNMYKEGGQFWPQLYPYTIDNNADRAKYCHNHQPDNVGDPADPYYINCYPVLCSYLSKTDAETDDQNDGPDIPPFHQMGEVTYGRLAKSQNDLVDEWIIDLAVPCFEDHCAQDWDQYVLGINDQANPDDYVLPYDLEHEVFGCDLWIEVTGISRVDQPDEGEETASVSLENKDADGWYVINDNTMGTLVYTTEGPTFDYTLVAQGLNPTTDYSLIYYADPWPGNNPGALLGTFTTDASGDIVSTPGSVALGHDLPHSSDANYGSGAKVWLVLSSDYDAASFSMTGWQQTEYLFEYNVINYIYTL